MYDSPLYPRSSYVKNCVASVKCRLHPVKARRLRGRAIYVESKPEHMFPTLIERDDEGHCFVDSAALDWSNNSALMELRFLKEKILEFYAYRERIRNNFGSIERPMQCD